jgi:hypothetical protein
VKASCERSSSSEYAKRLAHAFVVVNVTHSFYVQPTPSIASCLAREIDLVRTAAHSARVARAGPLRPHACTKSVLRVFTHGTWWRTYRKRKHPMARRSQSEPFRSCSAVLPACRRSTLPQQRMRSRRRWCGRSSSMRDRQQGVSLTLG